jgi:hypothetical protein
MLRNRVPAIGTTGGGGGGGITGTASGVADVTGSATAKVFLKANFSGAVVTVGSATAKAAVKATAAGTAAVTGSATIGLVPAFLNANGLVAVTGSGAAKVSNKAVASAIVGVSGSASARVLNKAQASGEVTVTGSAQGVSVVERLYNINIIALPASEQPITALQYRVGGGPWLDLGGATTGVYQVTVLIGATVQIRAVSSAGAGNASDTKFAA